MCAAWLYCEVHDAFFFTEFGKQDGQRLEKLVSAVGNSPLLFITDASPSCRFLVDSGAEVSVTPFSSAKPASFNLKTADGKPVPCWGRVELPVNIAGVDYGLHPFVKADVQQPILGADFFSRTGLCIDVKRRILFLILYLLNFN